jgi:uncharacterized membrane protein YdjX (TVP38/TMEM64 family)
MPYARWLALFVLTLAAILIPFFLFGERIERFTANLLASEAGWWATSAALTSLLALDILLPVPSSIVSTAAGALLGFWGGLACSWLGMSAGCVLGYLLGRGVTSTNDFVRVEQARRRYGDLVLVLFRAVPVLAEASVLLAGFVRMPWPRFFLLTALSNLGISLAYVATTVYSVRRESFLLAFAGATVVPGLGMLLARGLGVKRTH